MRTSTILTSLLVLVPSVAVAEGELTTTPPQLYGLVAGPPTASHITFVRQMLPANGPNTIAALAQSKTIYLNKDGVTLTPGNNDSRTNRSSLVGSTRTVPAWNVSAAAACFPSRTSRICWPGCGWADQRRPTPRPWT